MTGGVVVALKASEVHIITKNVGCEFETPTGKVYFLNRHFFYNKSLTINMQKKIVQTIFRKLSIVSICSRNY